MITRISLRNFKSLRDFEFSPAAFTALIGLNGAGKSTVLQALDFAGRLAQGKLTEWLEEREWKAEELYAQFLAPMPHDAIHLEVDFKCAGGAVLCWELDLDFVTPEGESTVFLTTRESIRLGETLLLESTPALHPAKIRTAAGADREISGLTYEGSLLSVLDLKEDAPELGEFKKFLLGLKSLELLNPQLMRGKSRNATDIGRSGEKLASFLAKLPDEKRRVLTTQAQVFYPHLCALETRTEPYGWTQLYVTECYGDTPRVFPATHLNDGLLRALAILAQAHSGHSFLLFDEIENGLNPEIIQGVLEALVAMSNSGQQVLVTTHSPLVLNLLPDDIAKQGTFLLYRDDKGGTRATRFYDLPEIREKLESMGPGEAMVHTNLTRLSQNIPAEA